MLTHALLLTAFLSAVLAAPTASIAELDPQPHTLVSRKWPLTDFGMGCAWPYIYKVTSQTEVDETPHRVTGAQAGPDPAGGTLIAGYSYSVDVSVSGGVSAAFTFKEVFNFGYTATRSISYSKGASISVAQACPANVKCGLTASARLLKVDGTMTQTICPWGYKSIPCNAPPQCKLNLGADFGVPVPFTAYYPITIGSSRVGGQDQAIVTYRACSVDTPVAGMDICPSS